MRVQINNVSHDYAGTSVLRGINAAITPGVRIGIVGANGCGKTTLVRIITGELEPADGSIVVDPGTTVGFVPQSMDAGEAETVREYLLADTLSLRSRLRELEHAMAEPTDRLDRILADYERARERYDACFGDTAEERAQRLIGELGLEAGLDSKLATLSGGEQNVLALGRAVIAQPDLLVLDEPGNHLDFAGLAWLEDYLRRYPGAVCIVSHNRYLLDRVAQTIWEVDGGRLAEYTGNYSDYRFARLTKALSDQASHAVEQRKLARLEDLVRTFEERARVTGDPKWGKRLRARRTQLEKARDASLDAPSLDHDPIEPVFHRTDVRSDIAVDIRDYRKAFGDRVLFDDARLTVHVGDRVGIVGPNGSGKTTLLEELVSSGSWEHPRLRVGPSMRVGYCAQKRDRFPGKTAVLDAMLSAGSFTRNEVFGVLSRLRFAWEDLDRPIGTLSGGEWNRLQLALAIIGRANLLILDEPTNHLDIPSREAVEEALGEFDGTIITVSHDRYFLDAVAHTIVELSGRSLAVYDGDFTSFWRTRAPSLLRSAAGAPRVSVERRHTAVRPASDRGGGSQRGETARTEAEIVRLEARRDELEGRMTRAFEDGNYREGRRLGDELAGVRARIDELYDRWGA